MTHASLTGKRDEEAEVAHLEPGRGVGAGTFGGMLDTAFEPRASELETSRFALSASSRRQCPVFASLTVTSTGLGHGSVAAGVADGPGCSGLGRVDGVSLGCARG